MDRMVMLDLAGIARLVVMARGMVVHKPQFALHAHTGRRAQHGASHRAPDGEQRSEQQQEPDAKQFHERKVSRRTLSTFAWSRATD